MNNKLVNILVKIVDVLIFLSMSWLCLLVMIKSVKDYSILFGVAFLTAIILSFWVNKKINRVLKGFPERKLHLFFLALLVIAYGVTLFIAFALRVDVVNTWDYGQLLRTAYETVVNGNFENLPYYVRYPNNGLYLLIITAYFKLISFFVKGDIYHFINATIPLNCLLVILSVFFVYLCAKKLWGIRKGIKCGLVMLGMSPLYLYATIAYTDVFAVFPVSLILYSFVSMKKAESSSAKVKWIALTAGIAALGYKIKATLIILFIAVLIELCLLLLQKKSSIKYLIIYLCVFVIVVKFSSVLSLHFLHEHGVSDELMEQGEFPVTHWIMMTLNPKYDGGYNQEDVDYTIRYENKDAKKEANIGEIKTRIKDMGVVGTAKHLLVKKLFRMWAVGDCNASDYVNRQPLTKNIVREVFALDGEYNYCYRFLAQIYHFCLLFFIWIKAIQNLLSKNDGVRDTFLFELSILGVFLFFLLWECNSRYLFVFLPVSALAATAKRENARID